MAARKKKARRARASTQAAPAGKQGEMVLNPVHMADGTRTYKIVELVNLTEPTPDNPLTPEEVTALINDPQMKVTIRWPLPEESAS